MHKHRVTSNSSHASLSCTPSLRKAFAFLNSKLLPLPPLKSLLYLPSALRFYTEKAPFTWSSRTLPLTPWEPRAPARGPPKPPEPPWDTGRRWTRHRASRAGRAEPPGTGVVSLCRPGVTGTREPPDGRPGGAAAALSHGPDSAKPRRTTPPRTAASPAEVIMVPPACPRRGNRGGPKGPGKGGSGPVRANRGSAAAAAAARPGSAAKGLFRRLRAALGKGARVIACAGRRRNRQAGGGQPCRWGPCTVCGPSRTPRHPRGPLGAPHSPHGLLTASRAPKPRTTAGAGAVSSPRVTLLVPAFVPWALSVPRQCEDQRFYPMGFQLLPAASAAQGRRDTQADGFAPRKAQLRRSDATHKRPKCPDLRSINFSLFLLNRKKQPIKGLNSLRMHNGIS